MSSDVHAFATRQKRKIMADIPSGLTALVAPPPPIFVGVSQIGTHTNWVNESRQLSFAAVQGELPQARSIIARHNPQIAQWVPECIFDGLTVAAYKGDAEMVDLLGPLADLEDRAQIKRVLSAAAHPVPGKGEKALDMAFKHLVWPRVRGLQGD